MTSRKKHHPPTPGGWTAEGLDVEFQVTVAAQDGGPFNGLPIIHIFPEMKEARQFFADHVTQKALRGDKIDASLRAVVRHRRAAQTGSADR